MSDPLPREDEAKYRRLPRGWHEAGVSTRFTARSRNPSDKPARPPMEGDMFTLLDVQALMRDLATMKVLSVYLETRVTDPAMRDAWRPVLSTALRHLGTSLPEREHPEFERARAVLEDMAPGLGSVRGAEGWVAFVTAAGARHAVDVPTPCPTLAAWREGPVIAPYMRVLKEHRHVIVALVDSRSAQLYRYAWGMLEELPEMALSVVEHPAAGSAHGPERRGKAFPAPRSATGTERASRRKEAAFESLATALAASLADLAGEDGWILIGGTRDWARLAGEALPTRLTGRAMVSTTLDQDATAVEITGEAQHAATALRAAHGQALLDSLLEDASGAGRAASGIPAVQRALRERAVDLLVLSPAFVRDEAEEAEEAVRAALLHGAEVEVLSGDAAERLDQMANGVGARLRFAME